MPYAIRLAPQTREHLKSLSAREQNILLDAIEEQLSYEPLVRTNKRRPLDPNPVAPWELRVSDLRTLYDVDEAAQRVDVLVIGKKIREKFFVAGKEVKL